jgi:hypothetical protein
VTPTTGLASGTAGSGTTTTSVVKPAGAADWTASDLVGKFLVVTGGGGASTDANLPTVRVVKANTTTALTVDAVAGMDETTTFMVADCATTLTEADGLATCLRLAHNQPQVTLRGLAFSGSGLASLVDARGNASVVVDGCRLGVNTTGGSITTLEDDSVRVANCVFESASDCAISRAQSATLENCYSTGGGELSLTDCLFGRVDKLKASTCASTVFSATRCMSVRAEVAASSCTATPVYLDSCANFEVVGGGLTGSSNTGASTYGLEVANSGRYILTGSTLTGAAGDVLFLGTAVTWANLSSTNYGIVEEHAAAAVANSGYTKALKRGNYLFEGSLDISGRVLLYGYLNQSWPLVAQTATGADAAGALNMDAVPALGGIEVGTTAAGTGVRLPSNAAVPGVVVGVVNRGANALTVYAPSGGTVDGGASVTIATGKAKQFVSLQGNSGRDFWTLAST